MNKFRLRDYLPVLIMVLCAVIFGVLLATGVMDLDTVPQLVADRPVLAVLVVLGLYVLKGFSGVVAGIVAVASPIVVRLLAIPVFLVISGSRRFHQTASPIARIALAAPFRRMHFLRLHAGNNPF